MFYNTSTLSDTVGATSGYHVFFVTLIHGPSDRLGGTYGGSIVAEPNSSSSYGCGSTSAFFFWLSEHFLIGVPYKPGGSSLNLNVGKNGTYLASIVIACGGTYTIVSSIMGVGDAITTPYSAVVLVLEIEITMLHGNSV